MSDNSSQPKILNDTEEEDSGFLDFDVYADAISAIITNSDPNFTIGIYGEWGTGKSTMMKQIRNKLIPKNDKLLTVWFNAWRYEREDELALIALMKTIAYEVDKNAHYKHLKPLFLRSLKIFGKDLLRQAVSQFISTKGIEDFEKHLLPKLEYLVEIDKDTIYFDGLRKIEDAMQEFPGRIVVFIDDLDRCSPKKVLEVFESVKVFLGIKGFIYVIGLSHDTISKLITTEYKASDIKGADYIKKIIQIPVVLPQWTNSDISHLVEGLSWRLATNDQVIIEENATLIGQIVDNNPREAKRFINSFVIAKSIYLRDSSVKDEELLLVQALNLKWNNFYNLLANSSEQFRYTLKKVLDSSGGSLKDIATTVSNDEPTESDLKKVLERYESDSELWEFLYLHRETIFAISDWEKFRPAADLWNLSRVGMGIEWPVYAIGEVIRVRKNISFAPDRIGFVEQILALPRVGGGFGGKYSLYALNPPENDPDHWYLGDFEGDEITGMGRVMTADEINEYRSNLTTREYSSHLKARDLKSMDYVLANLGKREIIDRARFFETD